MSAAEVLMPLIISNSLNDEDHAYAVAGLEVVFGKWNKLAESIKMFGERRSLQFLTPS